MARRGQPRHNGSDLHPVKMLFKLFQAIHHLIILRLAESDPAHPLFMNMVEQDTKHRFKVAGAHTDPIFLADMWKTNLKCRNEHIQNQIRHHERVISFEKGALSASKIPKSEMIKNLNTANMWAKRHYGKKFKMAEFSEVERIASNLTTEAQNDYQARMGVRSDPKQGTSQGVTRPMDSRSPSPVPKDSTPKVKVTRTQPKGDDSWVTPRNPKKRRPESSPEVSPENNRDPKLQKGDPSSPRRKSPCSKASDSALDFGFGSRFRALEEKTDAVTPSSVKRKKGVISSPTSPDAAPKRGRQEQENNNGGSPSLPPVRASAKGKDASRTPLSPKQNVCFEDKPKKHTTSPLIQCFQKFNEKWKGKQITENWEIPKVKKNYSSGGH